MKKLANLLSLIGLLLFCYTIIARFIGEKSIMGFSKISIFNQGFTAVGMFSATACVLLLAVIAFLKSEEK
ncbi:MAG: hypothetical protein ABH883_02450 [Candidatus Omnitrophota bacterium]